MTIYLLNSTCILFNLQFNFYSKDIHDWRLTSTNMNFSAHCVHRATRHYSLSSFPFKFNSAFVFNANNSKRNIANSCCCVIESIE